MNPDPIADLRRARFVLLTTFRSSGQPVATPVWVVQDREHLAVLTNLDSGKVRRLRRDASITLAPCSPQGKPVPSAQPVRGRAQVITDPLTVKRVWALVRRKYAVEHAVLRVLGLVRPAWRRWDGPQAVLHLDLAPPKATPAGTSTSDDIRPPTARHPRSHGPRHPSAGSEKV